jgi:pseudaminic acid cytidylyltransferase
MRIALIPARGGSKRIPRKNIKLFHGKPVICYPIEAARKAGVFDRIVVSTDCPEIARIALEAGAEVPFMRPPEVADDYASLADVVLHALDWFDKNETVPVDLCCCILATAPSIRASDIQKGLALMEEKKVASVFSVTTFGFPIFRALEIKENGALAMIWPEYMKRRSNDLPEAYHDAGQFYWLETARFRKSKLIYSPDALPVCLPRKIVQDIDTPEDWECAELMFEALRNSSERE